MLVIAFLLLMIAFYVIYSTKGEKVSGYSTNSSLSLLQNISIPTIKPENPHVGNSAFQLDNQTQNEVNRCYLPFVTYTTRDKFDFQNPKLWIHTKKMVLAIEAGALTYAKDMESGELLVDSNPYQNRSNFPGGLLGFTSKDKKSNLLPRWPELTSTVSFRQVDANHGLLVYQPLYFNNSSIDSALLINIAIDSLSGEVIFSLTGIENNPSFTPTSIDFPLMNFATKSVILGSGAQYSRSDDSAVDRSAYTDYGLYSPTMAVIEGTNSVLAVWSETTQFAPEYIQLIHTPSFDHVVLHSSQDPKQLDTQVIVSPPWRIGTYSNWLQSAKRWREKFEQRTGAKPLWENRTLWVRNIHAVFNGTNQNYATSSAKYAELASKSDPKKVLYFIWNGDLIVLFGDHRLAKEIGRPSQGELNLIQQYGWPLLLYHPYTLIYSMAGTQERLSSLSSKGWLPNQYQFTPDYEGTPENWWAYWTNLKTEYFKNTPLEVLHPGSSRFQSYLALNFSDYCSIYQANGAYLDTLGDDGNSLFPDNQKVIEGSDFITGEIKALEKISKDYPQLGVMSEMQSIWTVPYTFFSWEGTETHTRQNVYVNTRINHPLRTALIGSYSWTKEINSGPVNDVMSALLGTLPEISLVGDYQISKEQALWSQSRVKLFTEMELFNDLPETWDQDALAYYRSKNGDWFMFKRLGSSYGYVEILPNKKEVIVLKK
jgi:hypothetical protein